MLDEGDEAGTDARSPSAGGRSPPPDSRAGVCVGAIDPAGPEPPGVSASTQIVSRDFSLQRPVAAASGEEQTARGPASTRPPPPCEPAAAPIDSTGPHLAARKWSSRTATLTWKKIQTTRTM